MKYESVNLAREEAYNDIDYADYEIKDYTCDEDSEDEIYEVRGGRRRSNKQKKASVQAGAETDELQIGEEEADINERTCDTELSLYNRNVTIDSPEEGRKRYARLAEIARTGTKEEKNAAQEEACLYMKGLVRDIIKRKFCTYTERDSFYAEELEQEAFYNIVKYLDRYDPNKGLPTTFFFPHIKSAMVSHTNGMKNRISSSDASLKRKINKVREEFKKLGREAEAADYAIETGETLSKIRSVLNMMALDTNTHLEAIDEYDDLIPGDPTTNIMYDTPENLAIRNIMVEGILKRMREKFSEEEIRIFIRCKVNLEPIPVIAKELGGKGGDDKVRRIIENIRNSIFYDPEIRKLCAGYIRQDPIDLAVITIIPLEGENKNMDLLETCIL